MKTCKRLKNAKNIGKRAPDEDEVRRVRWTAFIFSLAEPAGLQDRQ